MLGVADAREHRRLVDEAAPAVLRHRELRQRPEPVAGARLCDHLLRLRPEAALRERLDQPFDVDPRVPGREVRPLREITHPHAIAADGGERRAPGRLLQVPGLARRDRHARCEALDVPLPRARQRLVEVVRVEDESPVGRRVRAEVHQVRVAAELGGDPAHGRPRKVGGHDGRRPAEEGERRRGHPPVADRDEVGDALAPLTFEDGDRVEPVGGRRPRGVALPRHRLAASRPIRVGPPPRVAAHRTSPVIAAPSGAPRTLLQSSTSSTS